MGMRIEPEGSQSIGENENENKMKEQPPSSFHPWRSSPNFKNRKHEGSKMINHKEDNRNSPGERRKRINRQRAKKKAIRHDSVRHFFRHTSFVRFPLSFRHQNAPEDRVDTNLVCLLVAAIGRTHLAFHPEGERGCKSGFAENKTKSSHHV